MVTLLDGRWLIHCAFIPHVAGIERACRLEQQDVDFFFGHGLMFDAARHDQKFPLVDSDIPAAQAHEQATLEHIDSSIVLAFSA